MKIYRGTVILPTKDGLYYSSVLPDERFFVLPEDRIKNQDGEDEVCFCVKKDGEEIAHWVKFSKIQKEGIGTVIREVVREYFNCEVQFVEAGDIE